MALPRVPVQSSFIKSVGYDAATETLEVEFHNGTVARKSGVSTRLHQKFMGAESKGRFWHSTLKDNTWAVIKEPPLA